MRFYTTATNTRQKVQGIGGGERGQRVHVSGWDEGVEIESAPSSGGDVDEFRIYTTGGTNQPSVKKLLGTLRKGKFYAEASS